MQLSSYLDFFKGFVEGQSGISIGYKPAVGELAVGIVLHVEGDGAAGLGAAANVVELEAHKSLYEGALAVGLVSDDKDGWGIEGGVEFLRKGVELVVGLVNPLLRD